jgi:hypothetical protein
MSARHGSATASYGPRNFASGANAVVAILAAAEHAWPPIKAGEIWALSRVLAQGLPAAYCLGQALC